MGIDKPRHHDFAPVIAHANRGGNLRFPVFPFSKPRHFTVADQQQPVFHKAQRGLDFLGMFNGAGNIEKAPAHGF